MGRYDMLAGMLGVPQGGRGGVAIRFGAVQTYVSGQPSVLIEGETTATVGLPRLGSYTPTTGDRVAVLCTTYGHLVLGKVV